MSLKFSWKLSTCSFIPPKTLSINIVSWIKAGISQNNEPITPTVFRVSS